MEKDYKKPESILLSNSKNWTANEKGQTKPEGTFESKSGLGPPDGGWGWVVLLGGWLTLVLTNISLTGFGIIFAPLFSKHGVSSANIAWIFNVHAFIWNVNVLTVGPLCDEFGWRRVAMIGGLLNSLAVISSGFVPGFELLFLTYSVLGAVGGSMGTSVSVFVVSHYFAKRRGFALGIMTLGVCVGSFVSPLLLNYLIEQYGFTGASLVFGGIMLNQCAAGALFDPVEWHMESNGVKECLIGRTDTEDQAGELERVRPLKRVRERTVSEHSHYSLGSIGQSTADLAVMADLDKVKSDFITRKDDKIVKRILKSILNNIKSLRSIRVVLIALGAAFMMMGYVNFQMWVPFAVRDAGHSLEMAAWSLAIAAIANTCARTATSLVSDWPRFNILIGYMAGLLLTSASIVAFTLSSSLHSIFACLAAWGSAIGIVMTLYPTVMIKTMGLELFPAVLGVSSLFIAMFFIIIGPVIGLIRDITSSYGLCLWVIASMVFVAFLFWLMMPVAKKQDLRRRKSTSDPS